MIRQPHDQPHRALTLFDAICVIVGIIIGAGIYETTPDVAAAVRSPTELALVWAAGGLLSLVGALCYAELMLAYPQPGGDYIYLARAFGPRLGFVYAWTQFWVVRPGATGAMAFVFARYADELLEPVAAWARKAGSESVLWRLVGRALDSPHTLAIYAAGSLIVLTLVNVAGIKQGKWTQNVLSTAKVLGLLAIFAVAIVATRSEPPAKPVGEPLGLTLAMVFVLFTYGGWSDVAFVGAEMQNPRRNVLRALVLGIAGVTLIYILVSLAFVKVLGFEGVRQSKAVASETLRVTSGWSGAALVSALICVSALGAVNGMIFTGARIYVAFGRDHPLFAWLGTWNARLGTPVRSHLAQGLVTLLLILLFGTPWWSGAVALLTGEQAAGGSDSHAGFQRMVIFTTPAFWFFILLVGLALFKLRDQDSQTPRPFSVPWYPFLPFVFCQFSYFMLTSSLIYAYDHRSYEAFWAVAVVVLGVVTALTLARGPTKRPSP